MRERQRETETDRDRQRQRQRENGITLLIYGELIISLIFLLKFLFL